MRGKYNYAELNNLLLRILIFMADNLVRLPVPSEKLAALNALKVRWEVLYPKHLDKFTRTIEENQKFIALAKEVNTAIREIQQYVKVAFKDELTADDKVVFDIHDRKTPTKVEVPTDTVALKIIKLLTALFKMEASAVGLPGSNHRTILDGGQNKEILITYVVQDPGLPAPTSKDFIITKTFTHSVFDLVFDQDDIGKMVYIKACLRNTRGQEGPFGKVISAIISG